MEVTDFVNKLDNREFWRVNDPKAFEAAYKWAEKQNEKSNNKCKWSFDCGYKIDYDGDLCFISSRFYPPHKNNIDNPIYDGEITLFVLDKEIHTKKVEAKTLDELNTIVEKYVSELENKISENLISLFS